MPKSAARSIRELMTKEHSVARLSRRVAYVVAVEADTGDWFELDAVSIAHGTALADEHVELKRARGASVWAVKLDGSLPRRASYTRFWQPEWDDNEPDDDYAQRAEWRAHR